MTRNVKHERHAEEGLAASFSATPVLIVPGIGNSGPRHWQSLWQQRHRTWRRVHQRDWNHPRCSEWVASLDAAVVAASERPVLVAHSLGCLVVAHWASRASVLVRAALLVAVPDPDDRNFPSAARGFQAVPLAQLPFPSKVVASTDDPFSSMAYAQRCATAWGSELIEIGPAGHINAGSGLGDWPAGFTILERLVRSA